MQGAAWRGSLGTRATASQRFIKEMSDTDYLLLLLLLFLSPPLALHAIFIIIKSSIGFSLAEVLLQRYFDVLKVKAVGPC